ncbi:MAG TPA: hypothetical protein VM802_28480 [Chitinophaga sp.]|uniref:hypothetical protein n=1 Tax=Chitinophaga sp. TaxID=1869181 RepID=UPI002C23036C|nr:hypothetical protein [Chitinophaga sp.]HVI48840.1 hypothetical protein [Chitinophaga sp.]
MKTIRLHILFLIALCCSTVKTFAQTQLSSPAHIGLIYPISSNGKNAAQYTNHFSLHVLMGLSRAETSAAIAGISNIIKMKATGAQVAGFSNHIGATYRSATVAGFMNQVKQRAEGSMVAGFMNYAGMMKGVQVAGFGNFTKGNVTDGAQVAGFINTADSSVIQAAGFMNTSNNSDVQIAGFMNRSKDVRVQIGGFMNVARKVKGVQVGFLNISDSSDCPIGAVNIVKGGEKQVSISIDETATTIASFKSGGKVTYGILGVGVNAKGKNTLYAMLAGIGVHFPLLSHFRLNMETTNLVLTDFKKGIYSKQTFAVYPAYRFGRKLEVYGGPTVNYVQMRDGVGEDIHSQYMFSRTRNNNKFEGWYVGVSAGVQYRL